jgi:hypothetical protein
LLILLVALAANALPMAATQAQGNSRTFPETGKTLDGAFLQYWNSHGGLAQQGFPIGEEIQETSATDGKIYTVQYMERAVFEQHPEKPPPYNVLLSQLGTFQQRAKYGSLSHQLSGSSNQNVPFALKAGLALFQSVRSANGGYFYIDVDDAAGNQLGTIATGSIPVDISYVIPIPADGMYALDVQSEGGWTVNISQPTASYAAPPPMQRWSGKYSQATPLFSLHAGPAVFHAVSPTGAQNWRVTLLDQGGRWVADIVSGPGATDQSATVEIPADGVYLVQVLADGDWTLEAQQ